MCTQAVTPDIVRIVFNLICYMRAIERYFYISAFGWTIFFVFPSALHIIKSGFHTRIRLPKCEIWALKIQDSNSNGLRCFLDSQINSSGNSNGLNLNGIFIRKLRWVTIVHLKSNLNLFLD